MSSKTKLYPDVEQTPNYPKLEGEILARWKEKRVFERSVEQRPKGKNEFVFYDGPPFANGLPHYGHLLTGYIKDVVPRFQTMRGRRCDRRFGWDCHGLPPEMEAEKELKVSGRVAIQEFGIDKFNDHCRNAVMRYTKEWEYFVNRQARWVDFSRDYKTMDASYMESVMWAFKSLWDKGLVYEGFRVMPYSWACETPLSNFEIRMDNATRPRQDPAVTVQFALEGGLNALVWTTTPWTLPSNLALAVGPELEYSIVKLDGARLLLASSALKRYAAELSKAEVEGTVKGSELIGKRYTPLFPYFANHPNSFKVLGGDFVATEEGTGIVHMAPGFGEDDQRVCAENGIEIVCPVDDAGKFTDPVTDYVGLQVFDANKEIIKHLKDRKLVLRHETYTHNYPHCWRTDTPIIYRAMSSWYVAVSKFKQRMIELNKEINWIPEHIRDGQFGKGLESAPDWSISRNRFWGSPIPVWRSDDPQFPRVDVYGSIAELERDFGVKVTDLHRPFIDSLTRKNPDDPTGKSTMRRVPEVLDCWFESGSMPFAQVHYPFENREWYDTHFPADFITEYVAQTRGWFYTLMVMSTALFDKPPFRTCVCHGVVVDEDGLKLSKRKKNYPSPEEVFATYGSDALRWFLMSSAVLKGQDLMIDPKGSGFPEVVRSALNPLWNVFYFWTLYANADGIKAKIRTDSPALLDRYIVAKLSELREGMTNALERVEIAEACRLYSGFMDVLNNWYVRRSRERFWGAQVTEDKQAAYDTLYTVLVRLCELAAPLLPLITDAVHTSLTGSESVHLADWPGPIPGDENLVKAMDRVREICSVGLALREKRNLRTRLPLPSVTIAGRETDLVKPYAALIAEELNVKEVRFTGDFAQFASFSLQVNARAAGPRLGAKVQTIIKASKSGDWKLADDGSVVCGGEPLVGEEYQLGLVAKDGVLAGGLSSRDAVVVLDTAVTPELEAEGTARDLVRAIQQARKEAKLDVSDRINVTLFGANALSAPIEKFTGYICEQVLGRSLVVAAPGVAPAPEAHSALIGETEVKVSVVKVAA